MTTRRLLLGAASAGFALANFPKAALARETAIDVTTPMPAPDWALLEREVLRANTTACEQFFEHYFDERGYLLAFERWGGNDGPDDAIENCNDWPHLHALGAPDRILDLYKHAWEGHLRQYTEARTTDVPMARLGMFYKEFNVCFDWQHHAEELSVFNLQGLSDPNDGLFRARARRFAGFYMGEDPGAPNYDPQHRLIRSIMNGSRGPLLRPATPLDWAGDPFEVENRFDLGHGERNYEETLGHYAEYTDVVGDAPLNLFSTTLALNAYMIAQEDKYRRWLLDYVDAWADRARRNNGILPSIVGLDGEIGSSAGGRWWGGVYGWGFSPVVPQTGEREDRNRVPRTILGFYNAYLLSNGDDGYLDVWRKQTDAINAQRRLVDGRMCTPRMHGDDGWYSWAPGDYTANTHDIYYLSMKRSDRERAGDHPWLAYLEGRNPDYPRTALRAALARIREKVEAREQDFSTPDTRLADNPMDKNPATVTALIQLMQGGLHIARPAWSPTSSNSGGAPLHCRLRYFDPVRRRAGAPEDVGALVDALTDDGASVTLVNTNLVEPKLVTVQGGAYGEHQIRAVSVDGEAHEINARTFAVRLAPGAGAKLSLRMARYANQPTLSFPWDR